MGPMLTLSVQNGQRRFVRWPHFHSLVTKAKWSALVAVWLFLAAGIVIALTPKQPAHRPADLHLPITIPHAPYIDLAHLNG